MLPGTGDHFSNERVNISVAKQTVIHLTFDVFISAAIVHSDFQSFNRLIAQCLAFNFYKRNSCIVRNRRGAGRCDRRIFRF